jgi:hypothetical protein
MNTPFKIKWTKNIGFLPTDLLSIEILRFFKKEFEETYCDKVTILESTFMIVRNDFIRIKPDFNFNIWQGIGKSSVFLDNDEHEKTVSYEVDFSKQSIISLSFIAIATTATIQSIKTSSDLNSGLIIIGILILFALVIPLGIIILRQKMLFNRIVRRLKTSYNPQYK